MNDLTIIFFEQLAKRLDHPAPLVDRLRSELIRDTQSRLEKFLLPSTLYLSAGGREFHSRLDTFLRQAGAIREIKAFRPMYKQLTKLQMSAEDLRAETLSALASPGKLVAERVHIVFGEEANDTAKRIYDAICLEMYRLAAAAGGKAVAKLSPLHYVHPDASSYYQYYAKEVLPALALTEHASRFGVWAFQYREQAKVGPMARLPVYVQTAPRTEKMRLLPGDHHLCGSGSNEAWQGIGAITNLTPGAMQHAQKDGIYYTVTTDMLTNCHLTSTPTQILDQCFGGRYYAVDPAHFFAAVSAALCSRAINLRVQRGQCLYCGAEGTGVMLCLSCIGKVRQKL